MKCALGSADCFTLVNASGLSFEIALQATVAQGLANRAHGASVYITGIDQFPGMTGIEWFPGTGCANCAGLRERWLAVAGGGRQAIPTSIDTLLAQVQPLQRGGALYDQAALHSLGPVLTACGIYDLLPATSSATLPRGTIVRFDGRDRWGDATAASRFTAHELLPLANASMLALQAPTNLPFLADAVVAWRLPMLWMQEMCADAEQNAILRYAVEGSGHYAGSPTVEYLGWFNNTHLPNVELVCQCTREKRLITIASDWTENLSFLAHLPPVGTRATPLMQRDDAVRVDEFDPTKVYVAVIVSDGDNIAQDWSNLRPMLERRLSLRSRVPMSWTVSNRWSTFGGPVLRWFYQTAAASGGHDSFLMGPSGYGYLFPVSYARLCMS